MYFSWYKFLPELQISNSFTVVGIFPLLSDEKQMCNNLFIFFNGFCFALLNNKTKLNINEDFQTTRNTVENKTKSFSSDSSSMVLRSKTGLLLVDTLFSLVSIRGCVPSAHIAEPVTCCHLQTSLSSTYLACSLLFPSFLFLFSLPFFSSPFLFLVGFKLGILNQQPAASILHAKSYYTFKFDSTPYKVVVCWLADVCVFVYKMPHCVFVCPGRKLAKKRKDAIGTTRQEMTHMVNAMDRSYADQSTLHGEDPMAVTFMDSHNYNNRCRFPNKTVITIIFNHKQTY